MTAVVRGAGKPGETTHYKRGEEEEVSEEWWSPSLEKGDWSAKLT